MRSSSCSSKSDLPPSQGQHHFSSNTNESKHNSLVYPLQLPPGTKRLFQADELSIYDEALVIGFSLIVFSSVVWVPWAISRIAHKYVWKERNARPDDDNDDDDEDDKYRKRKKVLRYTMFLVLAVALMKPYANPKVGRWLNVRRWRIWKAWLNYVSMEVLLAKGEEEGGIERKKTKKNFDWKNDQAIFAIVPHGLFPFPLAFAALADVAFGIIRPVAATATSLFPFVRELLGFLDSV